MKEGKNSLKLSKSLEANLKILKGDTEITGRWWRGVPSPCQTKKVAPKVCGKDGCSSKEQLRFPGSQLSLA